MIKQAMSEAGLAPLAVIGLVMFVAVFVSITAWVLSRGRREVETWSSLPLADGHEPVQPRDEPTPHASEDADEYGDADHHHGGGGCGKCLQCTCEPVEIATPVTSLTIN